MSTKVFDGLQTDLWKNINLFQNRIKEVFGGK
jgi:hypothetical protein